MPAAHLGRPASGILGQVQPGPDDAITDIDGVLVGGASLEAQEFARIVRFVEPA